jgi:PEP-CTERM motif
MRVLNRCSLGAALLLFTSQASATPLNLTLLEFPDVLSQFVDVNYVAATDAFTASGISLQVTAGPGTNFTILNGTFDISITTDGTTTSGSAGDDLSIVGDLDLDNDGVADVSGTLLTGEIADFGASASGPGVFEFIFDITGGLLQNPIGLFAGQTGVILGADGNSTFTGSFDSDFSNLIGGLAGSGTGSADTAPIPEPTTLLLLGSGIAGLVGAGRRTRR